MAAGAAALAGGLQRSGVGPGRRRRRSSRTTAPSSSRRSSPPIISAPSPCRSTGGWPRPRCATSSSTPSARALVCDEALLDAGRRGHRGPGEDRSVRVCVDAGASGWTALAELRTGRPWRRACPAAARRRPPAHVHLGHHRPPQGGHAHPRQPGLEEPGPRRRVRVHRRRPRAGLRAPLPRRCARPHDHLAHRRRRHDHHPPRLRRRGRGRRARAVAGDHGVAGAGHGQRHHGAARHRRARPVLGAADHQRRGEDADPADRANPADVSLGVVRRRLRPHRDRVRRHLPRPRQHPDQARQRGPTMPVPRTRAVGRSRAARCRRASRARS